MKKQFHALSLCLTLALCVFGSTAALAEAPAATPAPQDQRVITDVSPLEDQIRNIVGFTTSTGGPYDFEQADHRSAVQAYGAEPAEGAVAQLRIYARAEDQGDASINSSGHSFLSVRNVSDHDIEVGGLRNDILAKYGDLAAYNPQVPYDYIVYYGSSLTPSKEFA